METTGQVSLWCTPIPHSPVRPRGTEQFPASLGYLCPAARHQTPDSCRRRFPFRVQRQTHKDSRNALPLRRPQENHSFEDPEHPSAHPQDAEPQATTSCFSQALMCPMGGKGKSERV